MLPINIAIAEALRLIGDTHELRWSINDTR
jgi:hypothetical protein